MNATRAAAGVAMIGPTKRRVRPRFYVGMAILLIVLAVAGFWPQYYGPLLTGGELQLRHWAVHVHSSIFLVWLVLFLSQAAIVERRRTPLHRRLGPLIAAYGFAVAVMGLYAGLVLAARWVEIGRGLDSAATFAFAPLIDMLMFAGFLAVAVAARNRPEAHKRLMLMATFSIALVGVGRLVSRIPFIGFEDRWLWVPIMLAPLLIGMGYDLVTRRRVHTVYLIALPLYVLRLNQDFFTETEAWLSIGRPLVRIFL